MPARIELVDADIVELGDVPLHEGNKCGVGEPKLVTIENTGTTNLRRIIVGVSEEASKYVQLAAVTGVEKIWAEPGQEIVALAGTLFVGERVSFWSRAIFSLEDMEREVEFQYQFRVQSVGRGA